MRDQAQVKPDHVRALFESRPGASLSKPQIYEALMQSGIDAAPGNRERVGSVLRFLFNGSYLEKVEEGGEVFYRRTGRQKGRQKLPPGEADRRRRERDRAKNVARSKKAPRERRVDGNTVARPKPVKVAQISGPAETVEQFRARGGKVQRLPAHWEQMERAA